MKLKIFTKNNSREAPMGLRTVNVRRTGKCVTMSRTLCLQENVYPNFHDGVEMSALIAQDEENQGDWYLTFGYLEEGFTIRQKKSSWGTTTYFCCANTADRLLDAAKCERSGVFLVSERPMIQELDGQRWYKIIIAKPVKAK